MEKVEKKGIKPEFCLSFSPNWTSEQIFSISEDNLACYGSNDMVYIINMDNKKIVNSIAIQSANIKNLKQGSKRKVTAVKLTNSFLIFTIAAGYVAVYKRNGSDFSLWHLIRLEARSDISFIKIVDEQESWLEFALHDSGYHFQFVWIDGDETKIQKVTRNKIENGGNGNGKNQASRDRIKMFREVNYEDQDYYLFLNQSGSLQIWSMICENKIFDFKIDFEVKTCDLLIFEYFGLLAVLNSNEVLKFYLINFKNAVDQYQTKIEQVGSPETEKIHENGEENQENRNPGKPTILREIRRYFLTFHSKALKKRNPALDRRFFFQCLYWLNKDKLILSGKSGEMFILDISKIADGTKVHLKPNNIQKDACYEIIEDNPHFKSLYFLQKCQNSLVSIGTDRLIGIWDSDNEFGRLNLNFKISCLGGKVTEILTDGLEKQIVTLIGSDKVIRFWDLSKKVSISGPKLLKNGHFFLGFISANFYLEEPFQHHICLQKA